MWCFHRSRIHVPAPLAAVALLLTVGCLAESSSVDNRASRWILLRVVHNGAYIEEFDVAASGPRRLEAAHQHREAGNEAGAALTVYAEGDVATAPVRWWHPPRAPPVVYRDAPGGDWLAGAVAAENATYVPVSLPVRTAAIHVVVARRSAASQARAAHRTFAVAQAGAEDEAADIDLIMRRRNITVSTVQRVATAKLHTIVLLAAGYLSTQHERFSADVQRAVSVLREASDTVDAAPWPRYFSLLNIFSVFEPSREEGASRPVGPGHQCAPNGDARCGPTEVRNNLDCAFGTPEPTRLGCARERVLELASFAPPADVVLVLVNDAQYGGTGGMGVATVSNGRDMPILLAHELGHAFGNLADEYSYGFASPPTLRAALPNCDDTAELEGIKWRGWIARESVDLVPSQGCMFSDLFRPTRAACLMGSRHRDMCSVCKEHMVRALYAPLDAPGAPTKMRLALPRCPPEGFEIFVDDNRPVTLTVNHRFVLHNSNVNVTWTLADGTTFSGLPAISVDGAELLRGANVVTATIVDNTNLVLQRNRPAAMTHVATFRLRRGINTTLCTALRCTSSNGVAHEYCGRCLDGDDCVADADPVLHVAAPAPSATLEEAESTVRLVALALACAGVGILLIAVLAYRAAEAKLPSELLIFNRCDNVTRWLSTVGSAIVLGFGVALIVLCVWLLPRVAVFGRTVFVAVLVVCGAVYLTSVAKFAAALAKMSRTLVVTAAIIIVLSVALFGAGVFGLYVAQNAGSGGIVDQLERVWRETTEKHPDRICTVQRALSCSGFYHSCVPIPTQHCPRNCDDANTNTNACLDAWQDKVRTALLPISAVAVACSFFAVVAAVADIVFAVRLHRARASMHGRLSYRHDPRAPIRPLTAQELAVARAEFAKADVNGDGFVEGDAVVEFVERVFREEPAADERERILASGPLSFDAFVSLYFPHLSRKGADPRQLTVFEAEEAEDVAALQQRQLAKLERYMAASGTLSPEALNAIYVRFARFEYDDTANFIDVVASAAREHEGSIDDAMCQGLTYHELEGLRCAWAHLHPAINGSLSDREIDRFYQLTHDEPLVSQEHFVRWKRMLDVRGTGRIGWAEFCRPFAQRSLLRRAREELRLAGREVEPEMLDRARVIEEFGAGPADRCFLPFETAVPVERVLALSLQPR